MPERSMVAAVNPYERSWMQGSWDAELSGFDSELFALLTAQTTELSNEAVAMAVSAAMVSL